MSLTYPQRVALAVANIKRRRLRSAAAIGILTFGATNPANGLTVSIGAPHYAIRQGADVAATITNLVADIGADADADVIVVDSDATTMTVEAKRHGYGGAQISTATTATGAAWGDTHLTYGGAA